MKEETLILFSKILILQFINPDEIKITFDDIKSNIEFIFFIFNINLNKYFIYLVDFIDRQIYQDFLDFFEKEYLTENV